MLEQTLITLPEKGTIIQFIFVKMRNTTNFQQETLLKQNVKRALLKYYFVIYRQKVVVPPLLVQIPPRANFQCVRPNIFRHGLKLSSNLYSVCFAQKLIPTGKNSTIQVTRIKMLKKEYVFQFQAIRQFSREEVIDQANSHHI